MKVTARENAEDVQDEIPLLALQTNPLLSNTAEHTESNDSNEVEVIIQKRSPPPPQPAENAKGCFSNFWPNLREAYNVKRNLKELFQPRTTGLTILDGIRAIGIIWVIGSHTWWVLNWNYGETHAYQELEYSLLMRGIRNGDVAVDMFFVLSGFLIAHILIAEWDKTRTINLGRFMWRRWLRIMPAYAVVIICFWGGQHIWTFCDNCNYCDLFGWSNFLFINNFASPFFATCMIWTWSVAVEMQFYVVSPFIVWVALKREKLGYWLMGGLILLCLVLRFSLTLAYGYHLIPNGEPPVSYSDVMYNKVWTRMSPYVMGLIIAYLNKRYWSKRKDTKQPMWVQLAWLGAIVVALGLMIIEIYFGHAYVGPFSPFWKLMYITFHRTLYGAATVVLISGVLIVRSGDGRIIHGLMRAYDWVMGLRFFYVFATMSYTMYLIHVILMVGHVMIRPTIELTFWRFIEFWLEHIAMSFVVALPLHLFVEKPWMNMRC